MTPIKYHRLPVGANSLYKDDVVKVEFSRYGRGLFAASRIDKQVAIGPYLGQRLSDEEASFEQELGNMYLFEVSKDVVIDGREKRYSTVLRYSNCADRRKDQNCDFAVLDSGEVWLVTNRVIEAGIELLPFYKLSQRYTAMPCIDSRWLRARVQAKDDFNALVACEKHRRQLEEQLSDLEDRFAVEQQTVTKYLYQQRVVQEAKGICCRRNDRGGSGTGRR